MRSILIYLLLSISLVGYSTGTTAEVNAIPMPGDTKLVVFNYDPNDTYTIFSRPYAVTDIELSADENIIAFALGDTIQWKAEQAENHIFIKPAAPDIFTSATLVTTKRSYQITLRSSPLNGKWYQKVSWTQPSLVSMKKAQAAKGEAEKLISESEHASERLDDGLIDFDKLNFGYRITGNSEFKPLQIMDDGRFTWIRMPANIQELPALFAKTPSGELELVNFTVRKDYMIVHRIAQSYILKVGKDEIRIDRDGVKNRGTKGWLDS